MAPSIPQLLIIILIIALLFGTKRLRSLGTDLGAAIRGFKKSIKEEDKVETDSSTTLQSIAKKSDLADESKKTHSDSKE